MKASIYLFRDAGPYCMGTEVDAGLYCMGTNQATGPFAGYKQSGDQTVGTNCPRTQNFTVGLAGVL